MPTTPATQNTPDAVNNASNTSTVTPAIPNKAPSAPTATPPTAPVSIIGTGKASDTLQNTMIPTMQTASQNLAAQNALVAAKNAGPQLDSNGKPFTFGTTPSQTPNSGNGGVNNGSSQNSSQGSQTPPEQTPGTPEHTLLNTPEAGNQYVYDPQGNRLEVPIGNVPVGMTTTPPPAPPTVAGEVTQSNGTTIKQLSDGTFGSYDAQGNYQGTATQQNYQDAQTANTLSQNIANLANGTYPLSPSEQAQVNALQASFQQLIAQQQVANANFTGGVTTAENLYGMGNTITGMGEIKGSIDAGIAKIASLNSQMAESIAKMEDAFKQDDMNLFKSAYDVLNASQKDRQDAINKIRTDTAAAAKDARDYNLKIQENKDALAEQAKQDHYNMVQKPINDVATEAAKYGAPKELQEKIAGAKNLDEALTAAAGYLQDPTSTAGQYSAYLNTPLPAGQAHVSAGDFIAAQKYKEALATAKADAAMAYSKAYNAKAGDLAAQSKYDQTSKGQDALEQQYRTALLKELSNRSGGLGLQDSKVNQAIHLKALFDQYKDPKTGQFNIPSSQYNELAMGLASLISSTNTVSDSARDSITQKTMTGDINSAITYATGVPQKGSTQDIFKNLYDSVVRQGTVAEQLRDQDVQFLHGLAPTGLSPDRIKALEANALPSFSNPQNNYSAAQVAQDATDKIKAFGSQSPTNQAILDKIHQQFPNAASVDIATKLGLIPTK